MGTDHAHGGDCCNDCARAKALGAETPCDAARRGGQLAPCDGGACANPTAAAGYAAAAAAPGCGTGACGVPGGYMPGAAVTVAPGGVPKTDVMLGGGMFGAAGFAVARATGLAARATGAIHFGRPPIDATQAAYRAAIAAPTTAVGAALRTWLGPQGAESAAEQSQRIAVFGDALRLDGETDAAYRARLDRVGAAANAGQRAWLLGMSTIGWLPGYLADLAFGAAPPGPGVSPATTTVPSGTPAPGTPPAPPGMTPAQIASTVTGILSAVGGTVLALVNGAREADRQARQAAADAEAARLGRASDDTQRLTVGVEAAANALGKARTAALILANGDRAGATTRLSDAQGSLAGAQAAVAYFSRPGSTVPALLNTAVRDASTEIGRVFGLIEASAIPVPPPAPYNPFVAELPPPPATGLVASFNALSTPAKVGIGLVAAAALAAVAAALSAPRAGAPLAAPAAPAHRNPRGRYHGGVGGMVAMQGWR